jgi:hypothetical protein
MKHRGCELMKCTDYKDGVCTSDSPVCKYRQEEMRVSNQHTLQEQVINFAQAAAIF